MNTKKIPAIVSLLGGLIALIVTYIRKVEMIEILTTLLIVLLSFYVLGAIIRYVIEKNVTAEEPEEEPEDVMLENINTEEA